MKKHYSRRSSSALREVKHRRSGQPGPHLRHGLVSGRAVPIWRWQSWNSPGVWVHCRRNL